MFHYFFFATSPAGEAFCFATKYLPCTNTKGSRLAWWRINSGCERIGPKKTQDWNHEISNRQEEQLSAALGEGWTVYDFYQTLQLHSK